METSKPNLEPKDAAPRLRIGRIEVGINVIIQIAVLLAMVVMINSLSAKYFKRWTWVRTNHSDLSEMTRSLLGNLPKPMKAIVFFSRFGEVEDDAREMLREYEFAAKGKLTIEYVEPEQNYSRAMELQAKYKFTQIENIIILDYDGRSKFVHTSDMAEMEERDQMEELQAKMRRQPMPPRRMLAFKGEVVLTNEILALTEPKQNKLYLINGHGEFDTNGGKLQTMQAYAQRQNLLLANLTIADIEKVPEDANMVMVLGPKFDFSARDLGVLTEYWNRKGRIFITIGKTGGRTPKLFSWIAERGVKPQDNYVLRPARKETIPTILSDGVIASTQSPITGGLEGITIEFFGATQSLELDRAKDIRENLKLTALMVSAQDFWGDSEFNFGDAPETATYDPRTDVLGPLPLAVQVEKGASTDPNVKLETPRLVIIGNSDFVSDAGFRSSPVAVNVASNSINWLLNREILIKMPPKIKEYSTLALKFEQLNTIRLWVVLYIPLIVALIGLYYLSWRHGKNMLILTAWVAGTFLQLVAAWYVLLWKLGMPEARTVPRNLIIAIGIAASLSAISILINHYENEKRAAAKN